MILKNLVFTSAVLIGTGAIANELPPAISYPFVYQMNEKEKGISDVHKVKLLEDGLPSLQARIDLIKKAKKTIDIEYFIYNLDKAGKLFTGVLIDAANRGVKIRLLVDMNLTIFQLDNYIVHQINQLVKDNMIEVRYYNDSKDPSLVQYRTHRKFVVIDDEEAIIGGRNIGDEYFDMSKDFNFHDRDMYIKGPAVKAIADTFDVFWEHKLTVKPKPVKFREMPPAEWEDHFATNLRNRYKTLKRRYKYFKLRMDKAKKFVTMTDDDRRLLAKIERKTRRHLDEIKEYGCPELIFTSDHPGGRRSFDIKKGSRRNFTDNVKAVRKVLDEKIKALEDNIIVDSPYLLSNKITIELVENLKQRGIDFTLYTNSLASTDAIYVAANFYSRKEFKQRKGMTVYLHQGNYFNPSGVMDEEVKNASWGTHSKTQIYDDKEVMIGTYNIDNRSNYYNAEMGIFCKGDQGFVDEVKDAIEFRIDKGMKLLNKKEAVDKDGNMKDPYGNTTLFKKIMMKLIAPLSILVKDLL